MSDASEKSKLEKWHKEHQFKRLTVLWFGIFSCLTTIIVISAGFWSLSWVFAGMSDHESPYDLIEYANSQKPAEYIFKNTLNSILEQDSIIIRTNRSLSALITRTYIVFLAVLSGFIISLIGLIFILARVDSGASELSAGYEKATFALASSSPGLFAVVIGVVLLGFVVSKNSTTISVYDSPLYMKSETFNGPGLEREKDIAINQILEDLLPNPR